MERSHCFQFKQELRTAVRARVLVPNGLQWLRNTIERFTRALRRVSRCAGSRALMRARSLTRRNPESSQRRATRTNFRGAELPRQTSPLRSLLLALLSGSRPSG